MSDRPQIRVYDARMRQAIFLALAVATGCAHVISRSEGSVYTGGELRFEQVRNGDDLTQYAQNEFAAPVTVDFVMSTVLLQGSTPPVFTVVLAPASRVSVGEYNVSNNAKDHWKLGFRYQMEFGDPKTQPMPYVYALPFGGGETHAVSVAPGSGTHTGEDGEGVDFAVYPGTTIVAAREGVVIAANDGLPKEHKGDDVRDRAHTNWILVRHQDGTIGEYVHLAQHGVRAQPGSHVARGAVLAVAGAGGFVHFDVFVPLSGSHRKTLPIVVRTSADDVRGDMPVAGKSYAAFEGGGQPAPAPVEPAATQPATQTIPNDEPIPDPTPTAPPAQPVAPAPTR